MAIPYNVPPLRDVQADYRNLDMLLTELFAVLARILESRGSPASELSSAVLTIRRPAHANVGVGSHSSQNTTRQATPVHQYNRHGSVSDETTSEDELDVAVGTSDAEETFSPPQMNLPDLLAHLVPARHTADCVCMVPAAASCRQPRKSRKVVRTPSKKTKSSRAPKTKRTVNVQSTSSSPTSSSVESESREPAVPRVSDAPVC